VCDYLPVVRGNGPAVLRDGPILLSRLENQPGRRRVHVCLAGLPSALSELSEGLVHELELHSSLYRSIAPWCGLSPQPVLPAPLGPQGTLCDDRGDLRGVSRRTTVEAIVGGYDHLAGSGGID
jgi:hypothetical protein